MITASEAKHLTFTAVASMSDELAKKLQEVISAASSQGSCKATFYPKNNFQSEHAVNMLHKHGYEANYVAAGDQRDNDRIEINWGL